MTQQPDADDARAGSDGTSPAVPEQGGAISPWRHDTAPEVTTQPSQGLSRGAKWLIGGSVALVLLVVGFVGIGVLLLAGEDLPPTQTGTLVAATDAKISGLQCEPLPVASPEGLVRFEHWSTSLPNGMWIVGGCSDEETTFEMFATLDLEANSDGLFYDIVASEAHIPRAEADQLRREQDRLPVFIRQAQEEAYPGTLVTVGDKASREGADACYPFDMDFTEEAQKWSGQSDKPTQGRGIACASLPTVGQPLFTSLQWIEFRPKDPDAVVPTMSDDERDAWLDPYLTNVAFYTSP